MIEIILILTCWMVFSNGDIQCYCQEKEPAQQSVDKQRSWVNKRRE